MCSNTPARDAKAKPPPLPTFSEPSVANTAGTMMKPAMSATSVSIVQMSAVFLPRFSCLGSYEP